MLGNLGNAVGGKLKEGVQTFLHKGSALSHEMGGADPDEDGAAACFRSVARRFGQQGIAADIGEVSYDFGLRLLAVAGKKGQVVVLGGNGVEVMLQGEDSEDGVPCVPGGLIFGEGGVLTRVSCDGRVQTWDLRSRRLLGAIASGAWDATGLDTTAAAAAAGGRHIFLGTAAGAVHVAQISPQMRTAGYCIRREDALPQARSTSGSQYGDSGDDGGDGCRVVTLACSPADGALLLVAFARGGIVLWDCVSRKRKKHFDAVAVAKGATSGNSSGGAAEDSEGSESEEESRMENAELTCCAWSPDGTRVAVGFSDGTYAVWDVSKSNSSAARLRLRRAAPPDPSEGPFCWVRTPVTTLSWIELPSGGADAKAFTWGLAMAGGLRIDEPNEADGISILLPAKFPEKSRRRDRSAENAEAAGSAAAAAAAFAAAGAAAAGTPVLQALEIPLAAGAERLLSMQVVGCGGGGGGVGSSGGWQLTLLALLRKLRPRAGSGDCIGNGGGGWVTELVVCSAKEAAPGVFAAVAPAPLPGHLCGLSQVTAAASAGLRSAMAHMNFFSCSLEPPGSSYMGGGGRGGGRPEDWLSGGEQAWDHGVPPARRDEALAVAEMLVFGHDDGELSFWEASAPPPSGSSPHLFGGGNPDSSCSALVPLGVAPVGGWLGLLGARGGTTLPQDTAVSGLGGSIPEMAAAGEMAAAAAAPVAVTCLDVLAERDYDSATLYDACVVAAGLAGGEALALRLGADDGRGVPWEELAPIGLLPDDSWLNALGGSGAGNRLSISSGSRRSAGRLSHQGSVDELAIAIAEAEAKAREIGALGGENGVANDSDGGAYGGKGEGNGGNYFAVSSSSPVRVVVRAHGYPICAVKLAPLSGGGSDGTSIGGIVLALAVADTAGVVSLSTTEPRQTNVLSLNGPPPALPCRPLLVVGPRPACLRPSLPPPHRRARSRSKSTSSNPDVSVDGAAATEADGSGSSSGSSSGVLFVALGARVSIFDLNNGAPLAVASLPELPMAPKSASAAPGWLFCVDGGGRPLSGTSDGDGRTIWCPPPPLCVFGAPPLEGFGEAGGSCGAEVEPHLLLVAKQGIAIVSLEAIGGFTGAAAAMAGTAANAGNAALRTLTLLGGGGGTGSGGASSGGAGNGGGVGAGEATQVLQATLQIRAAAPFPAADGEDPAEPVGAGLTWAVFSSREVPEEDSEKVPGNFGGGRDDELVRRACLVTVDADNCAAVMLLPSLAVVGWAALGGGSGGSGSSGCMAVINPLAELTLQTGPRELSRVALMADTGLAYLTGGQQRLAKASELLTGASASHRPRVASEPGPQRAAAGSGGGSPAAAALPRRGWGLLPRRSGNAKKAEISGGEDSFSGSGGDPAAVTVSKSRAAAAAKAFDLSGEAPRPPPREELFAGLRGRAQTTGGEGNDNSAASASSGSASAAGRTRGAHGGAEDAKASVAEGARLARENIEKLENLENRTRDLQDNAMNYRDMARELRRRQEAESECVLS